MNNQKAQLDSMKDAFEMNGGKLWGNATPEAYGRIQNFMLEAKLIDKTIPPATYMNGIAGFYEKINHFDASAIRAQAATCPLTSPWLPHRLPRAELRRRSQQHLPTA